MGGWEETDGRLGGDRWEATDGRQGGYSREAGRIHIGG
jgi:hypothetical protein